MLEPGLVSNLASACLAAIVKSLGLCGTRIERIFVVYEEMALAIAFAFGLES